MASHFATYDLDILVELGTLRGLQNLILTYQDDGDNNFLSAIIEELQVLADIGNNRVALRLVIADIEMTLNVSVMQPQDTTSMANQGELAYAMRHSSIIEGGSSHTPTILTRLPALEVFNYCFPQQNKDYLGVQVYRPRYLGGELETFKLGLLEESGQMIILLETSLRAMKYGEKTPYDWHDVRSCQLFQTENSTLQ